MAIPAGIFTPSDRSRALSVYALPSLRGVLVLSAFLLTGPLAGAAAASDNEDWANETIERMRSRSASEDVGYRSRRRSAVERLDDFMIDEEEVRPRRHARRGDRTEEYQAPSRQRARRDGGNRKVASLGREVASPPPQQNVVAAEPKLTAPKPVGPKGPVVASLGAPPQAPAPSAGHRPSGPINWVASPNCLAPSLKSVLAEVAALFGAVRVNSTCRSKRHNARVGGASRSYHLTGNAVDFRIAGNIRAVSEFLLGKKAVGGFKHYGFGLFHIDTGPRRTWGGRRYARRG
jgi:hypothetical protein